MKKEIMDSQKLDILTSNPNNIGLTLIAEM